MNEETEEEGEIGRQGECTGKVKISISLSAIMFNKAMVPKAIRRRFTYSLLIFLMKTERLLLRGPAVSCCLVLPPAVSCCLPAVSCCLLLSLVVD